MDTTSFTALLNNAAILLALGVVYDALGLHSIVNKNTRHLLSGLLVGCLGLAVMNTPWEMSPGIFFDTRWVLISLCGLFFGLKPTLIAAAMMVSLRIYQGGTGAMVGSLVVIIPAIIGLIYRYASKRINQPLNWLRLYLFGLVIQLCVLGCLLLMPESVRYKIIAAVAPSILLIFPIVTMLLGLILRRQQDRRKAEAALFENRQLLDRERGQLRGLINALPDPISFKDTYGRYLGCNKAFANQYGVDEQQIIGRNDDELSNMPAAPSPELSDLALIASEQTAHYEQWVSYADASRVLHDTLKTSFHGSDGTKLGLVSISRDITASKSNEEQIRKLAFYDPLTQLPNRRLLLDRLKMLIAASARNDHYGALLFIDLDHFKALNDTQGHSAGDQLLITVASRLRNCLREQDSVARLGGDEFVVMIGDLSSIEAQAAATADEVAEKIRQSLCQPYQLDTAKTTRNQTGSYHCTPSIGISLFRSGQDSHEEILKQADMAMYQSKAAGRNSIHFFDPVMQASLQQTTELTADLHNALNSNELELYYQPQLNQNLDILGAEVLLRWHHPSRGMVSPLEFIPLAENSGLIIPIGDWVVEIACQQLKHWQSLPQRYHWQIAVNVSARQFLLPDFAQRIEQIVSRSGIEPSRLKLELTESLVLEDIEGTIDKMLHLNSLGIMFSMDDFGTGQSSLSNLKRLPLQQLKIDQSFIRDIADDPDDATITKAIISLAQSLNLDVIAEGVETEQQRQFLSDNGCSHYQGYLFSRPLPLTEFNQWVTSTKQTDSALVSEK